jgi:hypothetical protein
MPLGILTPPFGGGRAEQPRIHYLEANKAVGLYCSGTDRSGGIGRKVAAAGTGAPKPERQGCAILIRNLPFRTRQHRGR